ncbi:adenylate/guanylate cyclase domain-containing protein [Tateyamaria sp.]
MKRQLTTILAADIVNFSRLIGADEEGVLSRRRQHQAEVILPLLNDHGGRVANTAGDSWLIEFPSAVEALRFAIQGQTKVEALNAELEEQARIRYRIGINVGDVVAEGDDLLGDGVNIAARLEALAPAGGVVISRSVRDQVRDRLDLDLHDLGELEVKNIARPVRAFQVIRDGEERMAPPGARPRLRTPVMLAAVLAVILTIGSLYWMRQPDFDPVAPETMALTLPDRPSIAVLPFTTLGDDASADWISDGITENIISTLSLAPDMLVIGRATAFTYKGRLVEPAEVATDLGVRYVLSGSVLKSGEKVRVTAELSDAIKGEQLWSIKEDSDNKNILYVQDRIAESLFLEMQVSLTVGESNRTITALAGDFQTSVRVIQGRDAFQRFDPAGHREAERIWTELHETNPHSPIGPYLLGWLPWQRVIIGLADDPAVEFDESRRLVAKALSMQEWGDPYTLIALIESATGNYDEANTAATRAIKLSPGGADANAIGGVALFQSGDTKRGIEHMLKGMRLEPDYPEWLPGALYPALLEDGKYDDVISLTKSVLGRDMRDARAHPQAYAGLVAAYALKGDLENARQIVSNLKTENPNLNVADVTRLFSLQSQSPRPFHEVLINSLETVGVPRAVD